MFFKGFVDDYYFQLFKNYIILKTVYLRLRIFKSCSSNMMRYFEILLFVIIFNAVFADVFLQNPRGSNNR